MFNDTRKQSAQISTQVWEHKWNKMGCNYCINKTKEIITWVSFYLTTPYASLRCVINKRNHFNLFYLFNVYVYIIYQVNLVSNVTFIFY